MMNAYPVYKETGVIWLGNIPESWQVKRIKHNTYVKGRIGWQGLNTNEYGDFGPYLVTGTDFEEGRINWETCHHISEERYAEDPYIQLQDKDLLITKDGTIGKIAFVDNLPDKATLNSGVFVTRPQNNDYITPFMYWVLNSAVFNKFIDHIKMGSTIQHLYQQTFIEFSYPVPSISEQQAIADFLDCKTAQIDTLIEKKKRQIDLLQEQRTALVNHAVTKGLNPDAPMKDSGVEWLGEIPGHWEVKRLRRYEVLVQTGPFGSQLHSSEYVPNGFPVVNPANMVNGCIVPDENKQVSIEKRQELSQHILQKGDIVFARRGELGRAVLVSEKEEGWLCGTGSILIRFFEIRLRSDYLSYYLQLPSLRDYFLSESVGSTMDNLNSQILLAMPLVEPPSGEQVEIVKYIENIQEKTHGAILKVSKQIEFLQEYRTALISEAVTGKIDVREWRKTIHE